MTRSLRRHPSSSVAAILMAAIGIALLTLALAVHDAATSRPPPLAGTRDLLVVSTTHRTPRETRRGVGWSWARLQFVRARARTIELVTPWRPVSLTLGRADAPRTVSGEYVASDYFRLLGVAPVQGRSFVADEDAAGSPAAVVVLADALARRLAQDGTPTAPGGTLRLNDRELTVIGIMPPGFRGLTDEAELWLPSPVAPLLTYAEYLTTGQDFITLLARATPGAAPEAIAHEVGTLATAAYEAFPGEEVDARTTITGAATPFADARVRPDAARAAMLAVTGAVVLHLLAIANLVALSLGRALARRRETAVTLAIGATPGRLWRVQVIDGAVPVLAGALLALGALSIWLGVFGPLDPLRGLGRSFFGTWSGVTVGWRLAGWWGVVTAVTAAVATVIPATWMVRRISLDDLRQGSHGSATTGTSLRRPGIGAVLLGTEAMLAVILVGAAAQLLESYRQVLRAPVGVDPTGVLTFELQPSEQAVPATAAAAFVQRVLDEIRAVPGVVAASVDGGAPLAGSASSRLHVIGRAEDPLSGPPFVLRHYVGEEHFAALGVPIRAGRPFTPADREGAPRVVIISESAARRFFPAGNAIGQRVWFDGSTMTSPDSSGEIVGIVGDVEYTPPLAERTAASFYTPYRQFTYGWRTYFVRVAGDPRAAERSVRQAVQRAAPGLPLQNVRPLAEILRSSRATPRRLAAGTGSLAFLGILLATCGIWAVVSHAAAQRRREMAIRLAHGATAGHVVRLLLADGLAWPFLGLLAGLGVGSLASGVLRALLYGVVPGEPMALLAGAAVFAASAGSACLLPALAAARTAPIEALKAD